MLLYSLTGHQGEVYALDFSSDGRLVTASRDRTIRIWDLRVNGRDHDTQTGSTITATPCRVLVAADEPNKTDIAFTSVSISEDGRYVAAGSLDGTVSVWDIGRDGGGRMVERLRGHEDSVYSVRFTTGLEQGGHGIGLVSGSLDKTLKRWDLDTSEKGSGSSCVKTLRGHKVWCSCAHTAEILSKRDGRIMY